MTNESNETTESNKPTTGYIPTLAQVDELHRKIAQSQAAYDLIHGHCVVVASSGFDQRAEDGWTRLENDQMIVASNRTGEFRVRSI